MSKPLLVAHRSLVGIGAPMVPVVGVAEIVAATLCVTHPSLALFGLVAAWKVFSES
jgi:hypothetical protein